jgi:integrase
VFRSRFVAAADAAGLTGVTPHDLRATHASWVADSHGILAAARRLGHSTTSVTTRHYSRPINERDAEVAQHFDELHARRRVDRARNGHARSTKRVSDR